MRYTFIIFLLFLCSCSKSLDKSSVDVTLATKSLEALLSRCEEGNENYSGVVEYGEPIGSKYSYCNQSGAYIKYGGFFTEEYGLYMPIKGLSVVESEGTDPSYINIAGAVYSYRIRG